MNIRRTLGAGLLSLGLLGLPLVVGAQGNAEPAAKEKAASSSKAVPFNGTLKALDKDAGTVTVGNRTFKLTPETKYLKGGVDDAKLGEKVGGSYLKSDDGTLLVKSIRFGPKPGKGEESAAE